MLRMPQSRRRRRAIRCDGGSTCGGADGGAKGLPNLLLFIQLLMAVRLGQSSEQNTPTTLAACWMAPIRSKALVRSSPPIKSRNPSLPHPRAPPPPFPPATFRRAHTRCRTACWWSHSPCTTGSRPHAAIQQEEVQKDDNDNSREQGKGDRPRRRRQVLAGLLSGGASTVSLSCSISHASGLASGGSDDLLDDSDCQGGALASETAIPGAYQQACMAAPVRRLPVRIPSSGDKRRSASPNDSSDGDVFHLEFEQDGGAVGAGSTGLAVWNGSVVLQRLLEYLTQSDSSLFQAKTVVELGCGVGVGSLTCAALGAPRVLATDGNPEALLLAQRNVNRNHLGSTVTTQQLSWGWLYAQELAEMADVVIGSDLTYSPGSWRALAETMNVLLAPTGYVLYVSLGHPGFPVGAEVDGFLSVAASQGLVRLRPGDTGWPFPEATRASDDDDESLDEAVLHHCLRSPTERAIVLGGTTGGGVRVVVLGHRRRQNLPTLGQ